MTVRRPSQAAGLAFHVINRSARRVCLFDRPGDYRAFVELLIEAHDRIPLRLLGYCVMPNHFHLVAYPDQEQQLSRFMFWLTTTHSKRWHKWHGSTGLGPLYQGRFKAFPIQADRHLLTVLRYVERNPVRAGLATRSEEWPWSSASRRLVRASFGPPISPSPVALPSNWSEFVNGLEQAAETEAVRQCLKGERPYGDGGWIGETAGVARLRPDPKRPGRPRKTEIRIGTDGNVVPLLPLD